MSHFISVSLHLSKANLINTNLNQHFYVNFYVSIFKIDILKMSFEYINLS